MNDRLTVVEIFAVTVWPRATKLVCGAGLLALTACGDKVCAGIGLDRVVPTNATIAVGESVTPQYQTGGYCYGTAPTDADYHNADAGRWSTTDSTVVLLDQTTGKATGRRPGTAEIWPVDFRSLVLTVHVR